MKLLSTRFAWALAAVMFLAFAGPALYAEDTETPTTEETDVDAPVLDDAAEDSDAAPAASEQEPRIGAKMSPPEGLVRLDPEQEVWIDKKNKLVVVDGVVVLREGQLEMFACPVRSKEHESVVAVNSKAFLVHTALLAVGSKEGSPVKWDPEYQAATGTEVEVKVLWLDADGKQHRTRAQNWVRNVNTRKPLAYNWVFAGSMFWKDEVDGKMHYLAEAGDLICVSNFPSATLDLPIESSQANAGLMYEAFTENIPPRGQPVRLVLIPKLEEQAQEEDQEDSPQEKAKSEVGEEETSEEETK